MPHTKKKDSLLNSDREKYSLGGQAAKAVMKRINKLLKKYKGDDAVKSDINYLKDRIKELDKDIKDKKELENIPLGSLYYEQKGLLSNMKEERELFIDALEQIEKEGIPLEFSPEGFPVDAGARQWEKRKASLPEGTWYEPSEDIIAKSKERTKKAEGGSLLNSDRERYQFGGQLAKAAMRKINQWLSKTQQKSLSLKKLIEEYDSLTTEQLNKRPDDITKLKGKDFDMFMINEVQLDSTELDFVLTKYPDFKGETAADVYKHTQSEKFVDDMYLNNRAVAENLDETRWAMDEEYDLHLKEQGVLPEDEFSKGGRVQKQEGGEQETHIMPDGTEMAGATHEEYKEQMEGLMDKETPMLPDEAMEEDYVEYVVGQTLSIEDQDYLDSALAKDDRLSELFDEIVESASEFSGAGPIEGPGSEVSDSIPARLSDGEFVFTAKAVDEIGADILQQQMEDAEFKADERQGVAYGGEIGEDEQQQSLLGESVKGTAKVAGNIPSVLPLRATEEELHKSMLQASPRQYYRPTSG